MNGSLSTITPLNPMTTTINNSIHRISFFICIPYLSAINNSNIEIYTRLRSSSVAVVQSFDEDHAFEWLLFLFYIWNSEK